MEIHSNLELISKHKDRLEILRQQQASFGVSCPAHIILEINEISQSIKNLEDTNLEYIDKMYYNIEKTSGYISHCTNKSPLIYTTKMYWNSTKTTIEINSIYTQEFDLLLIETIVATIEYENPLFYESLLQLNGRLRYGRFSLCGNNILYQCPIDIKLISGYKDLDALLKISFSSKITIHKIVDTLDSHQELIDSEQLSKSKYFKWCTDYLFYIIKQVAEA
jgi:hypothetical protein